MIFSFAENLFSIYSTFAPHAGAGHLLLLFGQSRQKRSQGKLPENGNFPRHPRFVTANFCLSTLVLCRSLWVKPYGLQVARFYLGDLATALFIFYYFCRKTSPYQSFAQAFLKACSFQRQRLWSLTAVSETPLYSTQRRGAQKEFLYFMRFEWGEPADSGSPRGILPLYLPNTFWLLVCCLRLVCF